MIILSRLREVLHYDSVSGVFLWLVRNSPRIAVGGIAGSMRPNGYISILIDKRAYAAHRLAWFYHYGAWPLQEIDHIDGNKSNNAIANLRDVDHFMNRQNLIRPTRQNTSGLLGAHRQKDGKFRASIVARGKTYWLGRFDTAREAHDAYIAAKRKLHEGCTI